MTVELLLLAQLLVSVNNIFVCFVDLYFIRIVVFSRATVSTVICLVVLPVIALSCVS